MIIKKRRLLKMLPFIIILVVTFILFLTELFGLDTIMASDSIKNQDVKNSFEFVSFFWTVGIVGGFIGLTLIYVSWQKYKAEEKKKIEKNKQKKSQ